jgi:hypothetical protein
MNVSPPIAIAILIWGLLCIFAVIAASVKRKRTYRGYGYIARDVKRIRQSLHNSEIFRDGTDLVISGNHDGLPVVVRFSDVDTAPGLKISCGAPIDFDLAFSPKGRANLGDGLNLKFDNFGFSSRFNVRGDAPEHAKLLLGLTQAQQQIEKLCCSSNNSLLLSHGKIELSEVLMPAEAAHHVKSRLRSLAILSKETARLPGANLVKVVPITNWTRSWALKIALAAGVLAAIATIASETSTSGTVSSPVEAAKPPGIPEAAMNVIPDARQWELADPLTFDLGLTSWMGRFGVVPSSKIELDTDGNGLSFGTAYLLITRKTPDVKRAVWVNDHEVICDIVDKIEGIAKIPKQNVSGINWGENGAPAVSTDGDALLIIRDYSNPAGATVYFTSDGKLHSANPADFHNVELR